MVGQTARQQAQANNRNFRHTRIPQKNLSISFGSEHSSHSLSVIGVPFCGSSQARVSDSHPLVQHLPTS